MSIIEFGLYFKELRKQNGYQSQRSLAEDSGISNGTIARIEDGTQKASPDTLMKLSKCLNVSYDELMLRLGYMNNMKEDDFLFVSDLSEDDIEEIKKFISFLRWKKTIK